LGDGILDHQFVWYLQDIHHRFSMNVGHVWSIFLCSFYYVMVVLLFWGHERALHRVLSLLIHSACLLYVIQAL
jgi:hypothetical protein